jgi:hypothetical protein
MKLNVIRPQTLNPAQSPTRVVEQATGREVGWVNRYLDREYVRRLADTTLRIYAHNLLHFVRWWESLYHTGDVVEGNLTESTLLDYVKFQSGQQPPPSGFHHQCPRRRRRSCPSQPVPRCSVSGSLRLSSSFFAAQAAGPGPAAGGDQSVASEGA